MSYELATKLERLQVNWSRSLNSEEYQALSDAIAKLRQLDADRFVLDQHEGRTWLICDREYGVFYFAGRCKDSAIAVLKQLNAATGEILIFENKVQQKLYVAIGDEPANAALINIYDAEWKAS